MKRTLLLTLLLPLFLFQAREAIAQASACPTVNAGADQNICPGQCVNLTATVQGTLGTTSYSVSNIPYSPYSYTTGTPVLVNIDDIWTPVINMPFCFQFYGNTYTQLVIGSNGLISFNLAYANAYCQWPINAAIPSAANPINSIMAPFHDIDPSVGSTSDTRWAVYGTAPCREFVVSWYNIPMFSSACNSQLASQQIVLHESTNIIDIYISNKPLCASWNGGYAIEGIQNAAGTAAVAVAGRNYPTQWTATNDGKRFMPTGAPQYTLTWYGPSGSLGSANPITVCPSTTTTYTATVVNNTCAGNITVSDQVTVFTTAGGITTSGTQTNVTCNGQCNGTATVNILTGTGPFTYNWTPAPGGGQGTATATGLCAGVYSCVVSNAAGCTASQTFTITQPPAITATQSQTNVLCNGGCTGQASVVASGGTGVYTYNWAPAPGGGQGTATATGLCAGVYTCVISSPAGCSITQTITITQPPALSSIMAMTAASCSASNGTATINVSGGTAGYTYNWTPGNPTGDGTNSVSGLTPGVWTCTVTDANGCTHTNTINVTSTTGITGTVNVTPALCFGGNGSATAVPTGGTGPYTYAWSPIGGSGATANVPQGVYTCVIVDVPTGCSVTVTATITQPPALATTGTQTNILCNGQCTGAASVNISGGTPGYTYNWAPAPGGGQGTANATGLCTGVYTVTGTDANGCTITRTFNITQPSALSLVMSMTPATCGNANGQACVVASGGTAPYSYSWSPSGGTGSCATSLLSNIYTVIVTDANGCSATNSINVTNAAAPSATVTATTNVSCFGGNNGSASITASGGTGPYTFAWTPVATNSTAGNVNTGTGLTAQNYSVVVSDANGCTVTVTLQITQPPVLNATAAGTNVLCNGGATGSVTITPTGGVGPYTYSWFPSGGPGNIASNLNAAVYSCTVTDVNGCTTTATFNVTQPTALAATSSFTQSTCGLPNGSACVNASGGAGGYTYSWSPVAGSGNCLNNVAAGPYVCVITDANNCTLSVTVNVPSANTPTVSIIASTSVTCFGGSDGSATASSVGGTTPYVYLWSNGDPDSLAGNLTAGTYTVTVTDANGCSDTAQVTITEPPQLTSLISGTDILCFGAATGSAYVTPSGGVGPYQYLWSPIGGTGDTATSLTAQNYTCVITDANGCTTTATVQLTEPPLLTVASAGFNVSCFGACDGQLVSIPGGGVPNYTFNWSSGCITAACNNACAGIYTVTVTDMNGCTASDTALVTEPTAIVINTSAVDAHCNQSDGSASANASGGTGVLTYQWISGPANQNYNNIPANTYSVIVTDGNGCVDTATAVVNNLNGVTATLNTSVDLTCFQSADGSIDVDATGGTPGYTYSWSPNVSVTDNAASLAAGAYVVTVTDAAGCTSVVNVTLTEPPQLTVQATANPTAVCEGTPVTLNAVAAGGTPGYTYNWNPGAMSGATQNIVPVATQTYTVDVTDANGCTASAPVAVTVNPMPTPVLTSDVTSGCAPLCVNFTDQTTVTAPGTITGWAWDFGDNSTSTQQNPQHCYPTPGQYTITLIVTTNSGCTQTLTMPNYIDVFAVPVAAFSAGPQPTTILNPIIQFTDSSTNAASWYWTFGDGTPPSSSTDQHPTFTYDQPLCYNVVLEVTSADGCTDVDSQTVCIGPDVIIYVPNAFTPDGNGVNDVFIPVTQGIDPDNYELWIFDRWGNMIWYTDDLNEGWNGIVLGGKELCQIDTYVWKIKCRDVLDKNHELIGRVSLIQ